MHEIGHQTDYLNIHTKILFIAILSQKKEMGNNNSSLQNDKIAKGDSLPQKDRKRIEDRIERKKKNDKTAIRGSARNSPETRHGIVNDQIPEEIVSEPISRIRLGSFGNRKISPTQQIFLDNVILPLGSEINTRILKTKRLLKIEEDIKSNSIREKNKLDENISNETHPIHHRAPAGISKELSRANIAALIAGSDKKTDHKKYPVVFEYNGAGDKVFLSGCFNNWEQIEMSKNKRPNDFISVVDLKQGHYEYQYIVHHPPTIKETSSSYSPFQTPKSLRNRKTAKEKARIEVGPKKRITVKKEDYNVFQALDMDSFVVANSRRRISVATDDESESEDKRHPRSCCAQGRCTQSCLAPKEYGQKIPNFTKQRHYSKNPPIIPPHLLHYMLNKKTKRQISTCSHNMISGNSVFPAITYEHLLPKPCHTLLNHLYAESIKEDVMTLSTTQRYRQKYVTTVFYRPIFSS